ncbi:MAG: serine hydrolase, partial [Candidatus Neomarinimicrobiota bacterium]
MDNQLLDQAFDYAFSDGSFTQAAVVIKDGYLVYERYSGISDNDAIKIASYTGADSNLYKSLYGSRDKDSLITSWSTAKSFVSVLIGIAIENGYITSITDSASDYISEWSSDNRNTISIKDLLDMRSGLYPACFDQFEGKLKECSNPSDSSSGGNIVFSDDQMTGCINRNFAEDGQTHPWF